MSVVREPNAEPLPGYRLIEPLGSGGFGEVWKCEAPGGLFKAIKFVFGNLNSLDVEGVRAEQELKALQRIKEVRHPFVVSTERIEIVEGELVIVMELADESLHDRYLQCQNAGLVGIPRDALLRYVRDAAEALDHMQEKHNLQHLDIKPRNLFLVSDRVKVADFGLVKHLEIHSASGILGGVTPLYASPETFSGEISAYSDQYSLAIVYQELLTGQRPFDGKNIRQLAQQHLKEEPELRSLPEAERPVVARALAKEPAKRFPNCLAFVRALYQARMPARVVVEPASGPPDPGAGGLGRPKTLAETMEDVQLEQLPLEEVPIPPELAEEPDPAQLGITVAQPQTGALRPTLIIGVGSFGRRALLELRCRFLDRFGDLAKLPLLRFLYVDTDPEAVRSAVRGAPEVALTPGEVHHLALQPVAHYRRRQLDHLSDWLPREKLYALPRSLKTQGSRALGRLAFADNHLRLLTRLRREIQQATHPDALFQAVHQTGLALRDSVPRVYVIAAAGGGGSGCLVDLGYALKRLLHQLRHHDAPVTLLLNCGAPDDPATPRAEQANVFATLTELNHFCDPAVPFAAQYSADGPRIADQGQPYDSTYVLTAQHRTPDELRDLVAHLSSYLFHELTTPLGLRLDRGRLLRAGAGGHPFRSFGTYSVWFPRGLLLRLAARTACRRIMEEWHLPGEPTSQDEVEAACARTLTDPDLRAEALSGRIEEEAQAALRGRPAEELAKLLATIEEQSQQSLALDDPGNWARQALSRVREWLGSGLDDKEGGDWKKSKLSKALAEAVERLAKAREASLAEAAFGLMETPGRRVATSEAALGRFVRFCEQSAAAQQAARAQLAQGTQQAWEQVQNALAGCVSGGGGFSFFGGGRARKSLRVFVDHLAAFARQCLAEDLAAAVQQVFIRLQGRLSDRLRDLSFCRQRLRHLQESLDAPPVDTEELAAHYVVGEYTPSAASPVASAESFWDAIRQSATTSVVLPDGEEDLERAAERFIAGLTEEQWAHLDQALQDQVLTPLGGLHKVCMSSADLMRSLATPLVQQAAACLGEQLPVTDVAQVEFLAAGEGGSVAEHIHAYFAHATSLVPGASARQEQSFLLIPASEAGKTYGEAAREAVPNLQLVQVPGQADLMFCREHEALGPAELQRLLKPYQAAYEETMVVPQASPHARFDIADWIPLDV